MDLALEAASLLNIKQEDLFTGGYHIYTTMDNDLQEYVEQLYAKEDLFPKARFPVKPVIRIGNHGYLCR